MSEEALGEASSGTTTVVLGLDMMMDEVSKPYRSVLFADVSGSAKLHEKLGNTEALRADPSLANTDPLGAGWFFKVKLSNPAELDALMDATAYDDLLKNA